MDQDPNLRSPSPRPLDPHTPPQDGRRYRPVYRAGLTEDGHLAIYFDEIVRWELE